MKDRIRVLRKGIKGVRYPKDALHWWMETHKLNQAWLARTMGRPEKTLSEIMSCKTSVTAKTALEIEKITGINAAYLLKLQNNLDLDRATGTDPVAIRAKMKEASQNNHSTK